MPLPRLPPDRGIVLVHSSDLHVDYDYTARLYGGDGLAGLAQVISITVSTSADLVLQLIVNGIALGALYALIALGFVLLINATGAVNFAQGELVMAGGYAAVVLQSTIVAGPLILVAVAVIMFIVGLILALVPISR